MLLTSESFEILPEVEETLRVQASRISLLWLKSNLSSLHMKCVMMYFVNQELLGKCLLGVISKMFSFNRTAYDFQQVNTKLKIVISYLIDNFINNSK